MNELKLYRKICDLKLGQEFMMDGYDEVFKRSEVGEGGNGIKFFEVGIKGIMRYIPYDLNVQLVLRDVDFDEWVDIDDFFYYENRKYRRIRHMIDPTDGESMNAYCIDSNFLKNLSGEMVQVISGDE